VDKGFDTQEEVDVVIRPEDIKVVPWEEGMLEGLFVPLPLKVCIMK
jgi:spermidine/putrescine transport system ATP-binding protein